MPQPIRAIVTDIEGTTTSIRFVHDVLFPYAREHMASFVHDHANELKVASCLEEVRELTGKTLDLAGVIRQLEQWIDDDQKATPLKTLQGLLWEKGYQQGDFRGHIYDDAWQKLKQWHAQGIALYIYSSGSVYAQKLLFGHTDFGDLTPLFSGYFDTRTGAKQDTASYRKIITQLALSAEAILFLSDVAAELDAAAAAGMRTLMLVRDAPVEAGGDHQQIADFTAIDIV